MSVPTASAAAFYQAKAKKQNEFSAKAKERIDKGEKAWAPTLPFSQLEVTGIPITLMFQTNVNDAGEESQKCHLVQAINTVEYNRVIDATAGHAKGPIDNNRLGTFFKHTISPALQEDVKLIAELQAACDAQLPVTVITAATDYSMINKAGLTSEGWYASFVRYGAIAAAPGSTA